MSVQTTTHVTEHVAFGRVTATAPNGSDIMAYDVQHSKAVDAGQNAFYVNLQGSDAWILGLRSASS